MREIDPLVYVSGAWDGTIHIWDIRESTKKAMRIVFNTNSQGGRNVRFKTRKLEEPVLKKSVTGVDHYKEKYLLSVEDVSK